MSRPADRVSRGDYVTHVGIARFSQRRGHGDRDGLHLFEPALVGRCLEKPLLHKSRDIRARHILDVRSALHQPSCYPFTHIVSDYPEASFREFHRQR